MECKPSASKRRTLDTQTPRRLPLCSRRAHSLTTDTLPYYRLTRRAHRAAAASFRLPYVSMPRADVRRPLECGIGADFEVLEAAPVFRAGQLARVAHFGRVLGPAAAVLVEGVDLLLALVREAEHVAVHVVVVGAQAAELVGFDLAEHLGLRVARGVAHLEGGLEHVAARGRRGDGFSARVDEGGRGRGLVRYELVHPARRAAKRHGRGVSAFRAVLTNPGEFGGTGAAVYVGVHVSVGVGVNVGMTLRYARACGWAPVHMRVRMRVRERVRVRVDAAPSADDGRLRLLAALVVDVVARRPRGGPRVSRVVVDPRVTTETNNLLVGRHGCLDRARRQRRLGARVERLRVGAALGVRGLAACSWKRPVGVAGERASAGRQACECRRACRGDARSYVRVRV
eukprot:6194447-Pleurochrysis_carterae.AAC.3